MPLTKHVSGCVPCFISLTTYCLAQFLQKTCWHGMMLKPSLETNSLHVTHILSPLCIISHVAGDWLGEPEI